jgi:hypothetical protein
VITRGHTPRAENENAAARSGANGVGRKQQFWNGANVARFGECVDASPPFSQWRTEEMVLTPSRGTAERLRKLSPATATLVVDLPEAEHFLTLLDPDVDTFTVARGDDDKERRKRLIADAKADGRPAPILGEDRRGSLHRRLRLPGTWNMKPGRPPHLVRVICESGARYSMEELLEAFPPPPKRKPSNPRSGRSWAMAGRGLDRFVGLNQDGPLYSISPDSYGDWLRVGMALHAETNGGADGLDLWDAWSAKSEKWSAGVCAEKWQSFAGTRGITGGTMYAMAEERGWVRMKVAPTVQKLRGSPRRGAAARNGQGLSPPGPGLGGGAAKPIIVMAGGRLSDMATETLVSLPALKTKRPATLLGRRSASHVVSSVVCVNRTVSPTAQTQPRDSQTTAPHNGKWPAGARVQSLTNEGFAHVGVLFH